MSYPHPKNLIPLAKKHIADTGKTILANGKVTNGKRKLKKQCWDSAYEYGKTLWGDKMIKRKSGRYYFPDFWHGLPYPYSAGKDLRETLETELNKGV